MKIQLGSNQDDGDIFYMFSDFRNPFELKMMISFLIIIARRYEKYCEIVCRTVGFVHSIIKSSGKFSLYPDALLLVLVASSWHDSPSKTLIAAATRNRI